MRHLIRIRNANSGDAATLIDFNAAMALETEGKRLSIDTLSAGVRAVLSNAEHGFYLVAEIEGRIAGSLMITTEWSDWRNGDFWWIQSVYVKPEFRRRGVYRALHEKVTALAKCSPGVCGCRLYVDADNATAMQTYMKLGMHETHYKFFEDEFERGYSA